jgi:hypothetical protein
MRVMEKKNTGFYIYSSAVIPLTLEARFLVLLKSLWSSSCLRGQVRFGGGGSSLHSGIEFGRRRTGEGSSGGRKKGWCEEWARRG